MRNADVEGSPVAAAAHFPAAEVIALGRCGRELERLAGLGLVRESGPAAWRGGRRSTIIALDPGLHFVGFDLGATSIDVAVTDGQLDVLAHASEPMDIPRGPQSG